MLTQGETTMQASWPARRWNIPATARAEWAAALLAVALYALTLGGTFIYDDVFIADDDPRVHDVHQWGRYFHEGYFADSVDRLWRPLTSLSIAGEWQIHGRAYWAFHLVNVLLHATAAGMVARLARRLVQVQQQPLGPPSAASTRAAWVAGLLFAAHPVHVEVVAMIVGRAESLATIGVLGALITVLRRPFTTARAFAVFAWFCLAIFSKEHGLLLPAMLWAWFKLRPREASEPEHRQERNALQWCAALLTLSLAIYITYRQWILPWNWNPEWLNSAMNPLIKSHGPDRWLLLFSLLGRYVALLVMPLRLSLDYGASVIGRTLRWNDPYFYLGVATVIAWLIAVVWAWRRRQPVATWCLLCLAISYGLVSNIVLIGTIFNERLIYLASVFVCVLIGWAAARWLPRWRAGLVLLLIIVGLYSWRTITYAAAFNDQERFMRNAYVQQPDSAMIALLYAYALGEDGRMDEKARVLDAACERFPDEWDVLRRAGLFELERGNLQKASDRANRAFFIWDAYPMANLRMRVAAAMQARAATAPATTAPAATIPSSPAPTPP